MKLKKPLLILACVGLLVAIVALYEYVVQTRGLSTGPSFCNISQTINCDLVNASPWSLFLGLPVASYGIFFYLSLLILLLQSGPGRRVGSEVAAQVVLLAAVAASIASVMLLAISKFVIGAFCLMCLGLYAINFLLLGLAWSLNREGGMAQGVAGGVKHVLDFVRGALAGQREKLRGLCVLAVLGLITVVSPEAMYRVAQGVGADDTEKKLEENVAKFFKEWQEAPDDQPQITTTPGAFQDYAKGDPNAPIQIVEFADFECPGCRFTYVGLESFLKQYEGRYRLVFKNYPLDSSCNQSIQGVVHTMACFAAHVTRCAGEQGKFWEALDYVFTDPVLENVEDTPARKNELLEKGATSLGLDRQALEECVLSERYREKIQSDIAEGRRLGLASTPSFWVNGKKVPRPVHGVFSKIFESIVSKEPK